MADTASPQETRRYLVPPIGLDIHIGQVNRDFCEVDVWLTSGGHCILHRAIIATYDCTDSIDVTVEAALYEWVRYLVSLEWERRQKDGAEWKRKRVIPPLWPAPASLTPAPSLARKRGGSLKRRQEGTPAGERS